MASSISAVMVCFLPVCLQVERSREPGARERLSAGDLGAGLGGALVDRLRARGVPVTVAPFLPLTR